MRLILLVFVEYTENWQQRPTNTYHMADVDGRELWGPSTPMPCSNQGDQVCNQLGFEYLQEALQSLCGKPVPVFDHPHCEKAVSYV